ncbi:tRNA (5-methylaminomethyl-2-thiouridine)(34)-methyltransferase MnmD [Compostibacter hankyongensis]|uniref:tRNA (5-methylaminomethyl-2-thiouridine)(34)-methyltransferase MnmD n=1 Tax=Compostibacter hankyongensis TaxID=1007089 RepID=A0ABP8FZG4_9BACT
MERKIIITADGSATVSDARYDATYHSRFGALQESRHVFIAAGMDYCCSRRPAGHLRVFEMGLGTGLNALLTRRYAKAHHCSVYYEALECFPLSLAETELLNYAELLPDEAPSFRQLHAAAWDRAEDLGDGFILKKVRADLLQYVFGEKFDLIYYDAFAPDVQPELWSVAVFRKLYDALGHPGVLATYCSKGDVRRAMQQVGFRVEKLPGPPGKREILRALK